MIVRRPGPRVTCRDDRTISIVRVATRLVRVDRVCKGGNQKTEGRLSLATRWPDEERDHVLDIFASQAHRVDTAPEIRGNGEGETGIPRAVVPIVVVEMDRPVKSGREHV